MSAVCVQGHVEGVSGVCPPGGAESGVCPRRCGPGGLRVRLTGRDRPGFDPEAEQQSPEDREELHRGPGERGAVRVCGLYR